MIPKKPTKKQLRSLVNDHVLQQYTRGQYELDPVVELDALHKILVETAKAYESDPASQRQLVCDAVMAISDFLKGQGFSIATLTPMNRILGALVDLSKQNRPDPLFCAKREKLKPRRSAEDSIRQGHLAAFADAWLQLHTRNGSSEQKTLKLGAQRMSGAYFGKLEHTDLRNAKSYQRQTGQHDLLYSSYEQMSKALDVEAKHAGGDKAGLQIALELQIDALNLKAALFNS